MWKTLNDMPGETVYEIELEHFRVRLVERSSGWVWRVLGPNSEASLLDGLGYSRPLAVAAALEGLRAWFRDELERLEAQL